MNRGDDLEVGLPEMDTELSTIEPKAERPSPLLATSAGMRRSTRTASQPDYYGGFLPS